MAATVTECYGKLLCAQIEMQQLRAELLGQLSVQHAKGNNADPNTALANILIDQEAALKHLKSMEYPCNETKIYDVSKNPPVLRNPIDVQGIDTTLQHDFLLWLEGFPFSKLSKSNRNKKVRCQGACAQLRKRMDFCCDRCMQCNGCNKRLPAVQQCPTPKLKLALEKDKKLRNLVSHLTLKTLENFLNGTEQFPDFPHANNWQDLSQEFVNTMTCVSDYMGDGNNFKNPNVKLLQQQDKLDKLNKLQVILDKNMKTECDLNLLTNVKQIMKEQHQKQIDEHQKQIDEIEKVVADLKDTITKNHGEVTAQLDILQAGQTITHSKLDNIGNEIVQTKDILQAGQTITISKLDDMHNDIRKLNIENRAFKEASSDNQGTEEKDKEQQNNYRSIPGGVVIQLDLIESEAEVSDVCFSRKDDQHNPVTIIHKTSSTNGDKKPYYETHKVNECNMLLKIENMKDGNYIIKVTRTSSSRSTFDVCVNYHNTPARRINKFGIGIPSSNNKQYWKQITNTFDASINEDRRITYRLSRSGSLTETHKLTEFVVVGTEYMERNFSENFVCFPQIDLQGCKKYVAECFANLLKERFDSCKAVILVAPNIAYHSGLINSGFKNECQNDDEHCLLVFIEEIALVLVVRISSQAADISDNIKDLKIDMQHLVSIHRHGLKEENLTIAGIIACPDVEREQLKNALPFQFANVDNKLYDTLFICKDDLDNATNKFKKFNKWWDTSFTELQKRLNISDTRTESKFLSNMIGQHMISMASVNIESFPTLSCKPHDQMLTLILNPKQLRAIDSLMTKKHIVGPFGSGKSVIGQRILSKLLKKFEKQDQRSTICYITCDQSSIVDRHVKKTVEILTNDKVKFVCGSLYQLYQEHVSPNLSSIPVSLDKLMEAITENKENFPNPHFVCDEVQSSVMTLDVAKSINEYLKTTLQDAHVVFIQQSIKKDREYQQHSLEADHFNLIDGLEVHHLESVMRMSVENQQLVDTAQQIIGTHKLEVAIPKQNRKKTSAAKVKTKNSVATSIEDAPQATTASIFRPSAENISTPIAENNSQRVLEDFDLPLKAISRSQCNKTIQNTLTTSIHFFDGKVGHNISGDRARLIYLPDTNDVDNMKIISLILKKSCFQISSPVCIASSLPSAKMLNQAVKACEKERIVYIPYLQQKIPTPYEKDKVLNITSSSSVLITDHKSFLGMECEVVVTIADPTETIIRHSIVEIITRCTCKLFVFVLPQNKKCKAGSLGEILDAWVDGNLVDTKYVTLECGDVDSKALETCESSDAKNAKSKRTDYTVHTKSTKFVLLSESDSFDDEKFQLHLSDEETSKFVHSKIEKVAGIEDEEQSCSSAEDRRKDWTFGELVHLLEKKSTHNKFNAIITSKPSLCGNNNRTLLHIAAKHGATECVEVLIVNDCNVKEKDRYGEMAIHHAANNNRTQVVKILLSRDPSLINATDNKNNTPLHCAAFLNHRETVELLLSQPSVDVNLKNDGGWTPNHYGNIVKTPTSESKWKFWKR